MDRWTERGLKERTEEDKGMDRRTDGRKRRVMRWRGRQRDGQTDREEDEGLDSWEEEMDGCRYKCPEGWTDGQRRTKRWTDGERRTKGWTDGQLGRGEG